MKRISEWLSGSAWSLTTLWPATVSVAALIPRRLAWEKQSADLVRELSTGERSRKKSGRRRFGLGILEKRKRIKTANGCRNRNGT